MKRNTIEAVKAHLASLKKTIDTALEETNQFVRDRGHKWDENTHLTIEELVSGIQNELLGVDGYIQWHPDNYPPLALEAVNGGES